MGRKSYDGFTMVELSISVVFVGILSISLAMVISSMVTSYRKGNTMAQVNTAGIDLVDDFSAAAQRTSVRSLALICNTVYGDNEDEKNKCLEDNAYNYMYLVHFDEVSINGNREFTAPIYGVYCTGSYSYIWNSGYYELANANFDAKQRREWARLKISDNNEIKFKKKSDEFPFRLLKVQDSGRNVCKAAYSDSNEGYVSNREAKMNYEIDISNLGLEEEPEQMIASRGASDLALYDLTITRPAMGAGNNSMFYQGSFILGTVDNGVNILSRNNACVTPGDYEFAYSYCAINKFSFAVKASGE